MSVFIAPHHDDETLFGSFLIQKHRPDLVVVLLPRVQERRGGATEAIRRTELSLAWEILQPGRAGSVLQWEFPDEQPDWEAIAERIALLATRYDHAFVPAFGRDRDYLPSHDPPPGFGVLQHERIGWLAKDAFGRRNVTRYTTYTRRYGRDRKGEPVAIDDPAWIVAKLRALACYESQIAEPSCRPHFLESLIEYVT